MKDLYKRKFTEDVERLGTAQTVEELLRLLNAHNINRETVLSIKGSIAGPIYAYLDQKNQTIILD